MKTITVHVSALSDILKAAEERQMDFVELDVVDRAVDQGEQHPAFLNILGVKKRTDEYMVDFGSIDEIGPEDVRD